MRTQSKNERPNNDLRPKIISYIQLHPGSTFNDIQTIFNIPDGTLRYHLRFLEKKGQIYSDSKKRIYYPIEHKCMKSISKTQMILINYIKRHPGITQTELSAKAKISRLTIRKNIKLLIQEEKVTIVRIRNTNHHYFIYPEDLDKIKTLRLLTNFVLDKIDEDTYWELRELIK